MFRVGKLLSACLYQISWKKMRIIQYASRCDTYEAIWTGNKSITLIRFIDTSKILRYLSSARRPHRLTARTSGSHPGNRDSIPRGVTNKSITERWNFYWCPHGGIAVCGFDNATRREKRPSAAWTFPSRGAGIWPPGHISPWGHQRSRCIPQGLFCIKTKVRIPT